jgi:hypothetical protein
MATNPSLFGMLGDEAAMQRQLEEQRAMQFANMSQEQRLAGMGYKAGSGLGRGVASLFGVDTVDPVVRQASQVRQLASQFDTTNPEGMMQFAQAVRGINPDLATRAAQQAQNMMKTSSEISKNLRERASADPIQQILRTGKFLPASVAKYAKSGDIEDLDLIDKSDPTAVTETKEGIFLINKNTGQKIERIGSAPERASKLNVSPEIKMAPDIVGAVNAADKATEKEVAMLDSAKLAKQLINETARSNNSQTWEAARTTIAKAVGESKLSNEDIRRTGVDPRLVQGALDWVNKKIEGVPNADIQRQLYVLGSVLENSAAARYDAKISRFRGAAEASKFPGQPSTYFPTAAERTGTPAGGRVVDWSSLK